MPFTATWMQLEIISEVSKREIPYNITYMWNLKYDTNEPMKQTDSWTQNRLVVAKGEGVGGGMVCEVGGSRCKLLYTEWINKVLLYSTENYIQYPMINHNEELKKKECIYMYN